MRLPLTIMVSILMSLVAPITHAAAPAGAPPGSQPERGVERYAYFGGLDIDAGVPTPESSLGYVVGDHFTRASEMNRYLEQLASASDRVVLREYGRSIEGRPLVVLTISSPANLRDLDGILARNRRLADPRSLTVDEKRDIVERNPAVVWLSYNVHGNEACAMEAAIQVAYTLAAARNREVRDILDKTVIVIDPLLNPDGHERYVSWYRSVRGSSANPHIDAAEHNEPWPMGRTNHYLFDLNRDWVWLVQPESRQRLAVYREYLPQLHIDYHEQGHTSPYFFGEGDDPYNRNLPSALREWTRLYGKANAEVFDQRGLLYSTKERFDYLYPGYGKVLPCFHGAIGMLCEQGGSHRAGETVRVTPGAGTPGGGAGARGYDLTLTERARNHFLTSMSYLETTAGLRAEQLERFAAHFEDAMEGTADQEWAFVISPESDRASLDALWRICSAHAIEVDVLDDVVRTGTCRDFWLNAAQRALSLPAGTWIIRTRQPMGHLVKTLFERSTQVDDNETYDITAWSVPLVFGLKAWYTNDEIRAPMSRLTARDAPRGKVSGNGTVAMIIDAGQSRFSHAVTLAKQHGLSIRIGGKPFVVDGAPFPAGSLIAHTIRNEDRAMAACRERLLDLGLDVHMATTGLTESGPVLGANANRAGTYPEVLLLRGKAFSALSFGQLWHLLDVDTPMSHTVADADRVRALDLDRYNVIVLPDGAGDLTGTLAPEGLRRLRSWVQSGGLLIGIGKAGAWVNRELAGAPAQSKPDARPVPATHADRRASAVADRVPGALFWGIVDTTHPLAAGLDRNVALLKRGVAELPMSDDAVRLVSYEGQRPVLAGVASRRTMERFRGKPAVTLHTVGKGRVVAFADDPCIRGFTRASSRLLLNIIVFGVSL